MSDLSERLGIITYRSPSGRVVVQMVGTLDPAGGARLIDEMTLLDTGAGDRVVVDMQDVTFLDCAGIGALCYLEARGGNFEISSPSPRAPRALVVGLIPEMRERLMKIMNSREWELMVTKSESNGGFVASDGPLVWGDLDERMAGSTAALDDPEVEITFPVSKDAALVAYPGARGSNSLATDEIVAHVNSRTVHMTDGIIMHAHDDFLIHRVNGEMRKGSEYFQYIRESRRRGILRP